MEKGKRKARFACLLLLRFQTQNGAKQRRKCGGGRRATRSQVLSPADTSSFPRGNKFSVPRGNFCHVVQHLSTCRAELVLAMRLGTKHEELLYIKRVFGDNCSRFPLPFHTKMLTLHRHHLFGGSKSRTNP